LNPPRDGTEPSERLERLIAVLAPARLLDPPHKNVTEYLEELGRNKDGKPEQVREGIGIYLGLWEKALEKGVVLPSDEIGAALAKIEEKGGLYKVADG
jgi:hypothetical protein